MVARGAPVRVASLGAASLRIGLLLSFGLLLGRSAAVPARAAVSSDTRSDLGSDVPTDLRTEIRTGQRPAATPARTTPPGGPRQAGPASPPGYAPAGAAALGPGAPLAPADTHSLVGMREVTRLDCCYCVALLVAGRAAPRSPGAIVRLLVDRGVLQRSEGLDLARHARRGYACLLFSRALKENDSVMYRIFSGSERYAYKHLKFLRMIPEGGSHLPISGQELIALLALSRERLRPQSEVDSRQ